MEATKWKWYLSSYTCTCVFVCVTVERERIAKQQIDYVGVAKRSKMNEEKRFYPFAALTEKEGETLDLYIDKYI